MQRIYYCPNCHASIAHMQRFCGHCGTRLQPARWNPAEARPLPVPYRPDFISPQLRNRQPQNPRMKDAAKQVNATMPADKNTRPLRRQIMRLLSSLIENQAINN